MPESAKNWEDVEMLSRNKTKILVVDDEEVMTEIIASMLMSDGYFVETATNGGVAFDLYCQYLSEGQPFDFVLTGLVQPGMNGIDLIEAILKKKPDQRFGFSTAYAVLPRPFERAQLLAFVRQM
jgi:CheY-like chemotaxis protein